MLQQCLSVMKQLLETQIQEQLQILIGEKKLGVNLLGVMVHYLSGATGYSQAATISLGTAVGDAKTIASITGQLMTMQEGDEGTTANARINLTGNKLDIRQQVLYII
jgi:hypothetical protein